MIAVLNKYLKLTITRYVVVGGMSYFVEVVLLLLLSKGLSMGDTASVAITFWFGLVSSFYLQKILAFSNRTSITRALHQLLLYGILVVINYAFTLVFIHYTSGDIGLIGARTIALVATTAWNYLVYKNYLFKK